MYHGNNKALKALDMAEQRLKEARNEAGTNGRADLLPGLNMALYIVRDTADDVAPARMADILGVTA